jgi:hypothetical protein
MNGSGRAGCGDPGIGPHHVDPAILVDRLADQTLDVRLDAHVCVDAMGGSARGFDLFRHCLRPARNEVTGEERGALRREQQHRIR